MVIEGEHLPTEVGCNVELQTSQDPGEDNENTDETVSDSLCRNSSVVQTQFHQLSGWLVSDDTASAEARCGGPGLAWLHMVCGCEAGCKYCQIL